MTSILFIPLRYENLGPILMRSDHSSYLLSGYLSAIILLFVGLSSQGMNTEGHIITLTILAWGMSHPFNALSKLTDPF